MVKQIDIKHFCRQAGYDAVRHCKEPDMLVVATASPAVFLVDLGLYLKEQGFGKKQVLDVMADMDLLPDGDMFVILLPEKISI